MIAAQRPPVRVPAAKPWASRVIGILLVSALIITAPGCQWSRNYYEALKGEGFPEWSESMGAARGKNPNAQPSGFFTDRRSEQIEKSLGGGF